MLDEKPGPKPELRVVSDTFLDQLDELLAMEERKRATPVDDPGFPTLARQVEEAAQALLERAAEQTQLAQEVHDQSVGDGASTTIEDIPADLSPARILAMWREADRSLADAEPGSPPERELRTRVQALRGAYQQAYRRQV